MAARYWTCRKCKTRHQRRKKNCTTKNCTGRRPVTKRPDHMKALDLPYEEWVKIYGEKCGICGRKRSQARRLDRDHDHKTGKPRGLLCHRCNRALPNWADADWMIKAAEYLKRANDQGL